MYGAKNTVSDQVRNGKCYKIRHQCIIAAGFDGKKLFKACESSHSTEAEFLKQFF